MLSSVGGSLNAVSSGLWAAIVAFFTVESAFIGGLLKLVLQFRSDNKELQDKVMDKVIPALEANANATQAMISVTGSMTTSLAVAQALKDRDDQPRGRGA